MASELIDKPFPYLKNDLILRAASGEPTERVPVWLMRQAGRYLPEFKDIRSKHEFFEICRSPTLACEVTLQPIKRFDLDAAIIFSDILVVPQALGMEVEMLASKGPTFREPLNEPNDIDKLKTNFNVRESLGYVFDAITLTRHALDGKCPLIGFSGGPWTLMSYMIEGGGSTTISKAKKWLYCYPEASNRLLKLLTNFIIEYLIGQILAGAQMVQVFESHAGILSYDQFRKFSLPYLQQISQGVKNGLKGISFAPVPMIVFAKDAHYSLDELVDSGYDVVGLDWTIKPIHARRIAGTKVSLQGNLDPCALYGSKEEIFDYVKTMLKQFGTQRYIANLGHGVYQDTNPDCVKSFVDAVHQISEEVNRNMSL